MAGLLMNSGMLDFLQAKVDFLNANGPRLYLFKNDVALTKGMTTDDFDNADFDGYASQFVTNWPDPVIDGGKAVSTHPMRVFVPDGTTTPNSIYGWYIYDGDRDHLIMAYKFPGGPVTVGATLDPYGVVPRLTEDTDQS